jgi:hypothetical protein
VTRPRKLDARTLRRCSHPKAQRVVVFKQNGDITWWCRCRGALTWWSEDGNTLHWEKPLHAQRSRIERAGK